MTNVYSQSIDVLNKQFEIDNSATTWTLAAGSTLNNPVAGQVGIHEDAKFHLNTIDVLGNITASSWSILSEGSETHVKIELGAITKGAGIRLTGDGGLIENWGTVQNELSIAAFTGTIANHGQADFVTFESSALGAKYDGHNYTGANIAKGVVIVNNLVDDNSATITFVNDGKISGSASSFIGDRGRELLTNHGTIEKVVYLGAGDDMFDNRGGTFLGASVYGGSGNDVFFLDKDIKVTELTGEGNDTIKAVYNIDLNSALLKDAEIENLTLIGTGNFIATGNALDNVITGNSGDNILNGKGGTDQLIGGSGDDTYVIEETADTIKEDKGGGNDTVWTSLDNYQLGTNIENLTLNGAAISGTGNGADNQLVGNELANHLYGKEGNDRLDGGEGKDILEGGIGNDTYIVRDTTDDLREAANAGIDTARTYVSSYTLAANVENLVLLGTVIIGTGNAGANALTGNAQANKLYGGAGDDVLNGAGGADFMDGGVGNDTYYVDLSSDKISEAAKAGTDTVRSVASAYTLSNNVENLYLVGGGTQNGTGNTGVNTLVGNNAANTLSGGGGSDTLKGNGGTDYLLGGAGADKIDGGKGADQLVGGTGADTFFFKTGYGRDTASDFRIGQDKIDLSGWKGFDSLSDLKHGHAKETAGDTIFFNGTDKLVLDGIHLKDLHASDFHF